MSYEGQVPAGRGEGKERKERGRGSRLWLLSHLGLIPAQAVISVQSKASEVGNKLSTLCITMNVSNKLLHTVAFPIKSDCGQLPCRGSRAFRGRRKEGGRERRRRERERQGGEDMFLTLASVCLAHGGHPEPKPRGARCCPLLRGPSFRRRHLPPG